MPSKAETFSVRLPNDVKHQVDELARLTKRSRSFIVKEALDSYMREMDDNFKNTDNFSWTKSPDLDQKLNTSRQQIKESKTVLADEHFFEAARENIQLKYF
jgi:predicted DNA-binding protein